ncbi:tetratricopeptide repeat protein [Variovorax sp. dw_308]|uniref:tetratricopeptide repeat protein n=2 Tax=unclassified Variovorax TaxID=663243 RepID=UPI001BD35207|nr:MULTISPECIES: tetratricopeptide repeat protein [unclassified Variovorax]
MTPPPRRLRLAAAASAVLLALAAHAQQTDSPPDSPRNPAAPMSPAPIVEPPGAPPAAIQPPQDEDAPDARPSALTGELFFDVLVGELSARTGSPADGSALMLEAARRTRDPRLYQRAVELALQTRSGDAALVAVRAWKQAQPESRDARRLELQILIAMNRLSATVEPLRAELAATPEVEHPFLLTLITRTYARATDKKVAAQVVESALVDEVKKPTTAGLAWATIGRMRLLAGDAPGAMDAALKGQAADPKSDGPAMLALDLIDPGQPLAEPIVTRYLATPDAQPEIRMAYARVLVEGRRFDEASAQLTKLTTERPELPEPWVLLGSLQAQARQDTAAEASLKRYVDLANGQADAEDRKRGLTQAYLLLAQLSERRKNYAAAESWLARIDSSEDLVGAQARRASLLARQGKMQQARELVRSLPETSPDDKKQKFLAEVQLLRDAKQYQQAYDMLAKASAAAPDDGDLIYDQAMLAEKLNRMDDMERLLRRLIELKPDNQNAYNALGYSFADRKVRLPEARELIRKAVQLAPDDPFIADSLGWVEYRMGNMDEASRILEAAYKKRPDAEIGAHLGEVLWAIGNRDRAVAIWRESSLADADNETLQETLKRLRVKL